MAVTAPYLPGCRIGIVGTGQLGRMMALAAKPMGYFTVALGDGQRSTPLGQVADTVIEAHGYSEEALEAFAQTVDVVTFEFENIPHTALDWLSSHIPVFPSPQVLLMKQDRLVEKETLSRLGFGVAPFAKIDSLEDLAQAIQAHGLPSVLKTRHLGYDGKGQVKLTSPEDMSRVQLDPSAPMVFEAWVPFVQEISVLGARNPQGEVAVYAPIENIHQNQILAVSRVPAQVSHQVSTQAQDLMHQLLEKLDYVGLLCVELFALKDGTLLINELAPRPHNSGHLTIEGAGTSQFEQHIRAICGLPLGATDWHGPTAMVNLLGPTFDHAKAQLPEIYREVSTAKFHDYGKHPTVSGRKMGHLTFSAPTLEGLNQALEVTQRLLNGSPRILP